MAINKVVQAVLRALSYPDIDLKKNYKLQRQAVNMTHQYHILRPFFKMWDIKINSGGYDIPVRLFAPEENADNSPLLLFFHGGGWVTGNVDSYTRVCANMAKLTGHRVASVDYRLAPEHKFPAAPEDCYRAAREIFCNAELLNVNPEQITLIGDSAGANLAAVVSLMARDRDEFLPRKQILIYPATYFDHSESSPFASVKENGTDYLLTAKKICDYMELYRKTEEDKQNPYFAPLLAAELSDQPETLLITAEYDPLRDEGEEYGKRLAEFGNLVEIHRIADALHGFFSLPPTFSQVRECYDIINRFLSEV